jgi:hypothetical protein
MSDFGTMTGRIQRELLNEVNDANDVRATILSAIKTYERRPWWFNQRQIIFYTEIGEARYTSTTSSEFENIVEITTFACGTSDTDMKIIRPISKENYDDIQDGSVSGTPTHYAIYNRVIYLYPKPDAVYRMRVANIYKLDDLVNDTSTNAWMTEGEELIRQSAKRRLALDLLHADDIAQRCAVLERDALDSMLAENRRRNPVKTLSMPDMPMGRQSVVVDLER